MSNEPERPTFEVGDRFRLLPGHEITIIYPQEDLSGSVANTTLTHSKVTGTVVSKNVATYEFVHTHPLLRDVDWPPSDEVIYTVRLDARPEEGTRGGLTMIASLDQVAAKSVNLE